MGKHILRRALDTMVKYHGSGPGTAVTMDEFQEIATHFLLLQVAQSGLTIAPDAPSQEPSVLEGQFRKWIADTVVDSRPDTTNPAQAYTTGMGVFLAVADRMSGMLSQRSHALLEDLEFCVEHSRIDLWITQIVAYSFLSVTLKDDIYDRWRSPRSKGA